jgi:hypothetical protein
MRLVDWLNRKDPKRQLRIGETVPFDLAQNGNSITIKGEGFEIYFAVEGIELPSGTDATFAVWALLPVAMEEGFNLHINRPIDPLVASNAALLSQIWEMWVPSRYRSISVTGDGNWSRAKRTRLPLIQLFSGGIDSTFAILKNRDPQHRVVATVCGIDRVNEANFSSLISKTETVLRHLDCRRIIVCTDAKHGSSSLTHGLTLASCLFLLSDLFETGALAADWTHAADMAVFPWGSNHVTNQYFTGSDFAVRTVDAEVGRTEKIAAVVEAGIDLHSLSFCRKLSVIPANCGTCTKCIRTKAMFLVATGGIPEVFLDNTFDERLMKKLIGRRNERVELFDLYSYAKNHRLLGRIPGLADLVEECRRAQTA